MKHIFLFLLLGGAIPTFFIPSFFSKNEVKKPLAGASIEGSVVDFEDSKSLAAAEVELFLNQKSVARTATDASGFFKIEGLEAGFFEAKISLAGYETQRIRLIPIQKDSKTPFPVALKKSIDGLEEVAVSIYRAPEAEPSSRETLRFASPSFGMKSEAAAPAPEATSIDGGEVKIRGSRDAATDYYIDGVRVSSEKAAAAPAEYAVKKAPSKDKKVDSDRAKTAAPRIAFDAETYEERVVLGDDAAPDGEPIRTFDAEKPAEKAGLLTAGEWNDLQNWSKHWLDLQADGELTPFQNQWQMWPRDRFSVFLTNENDVPLVDCELRFFDQKNEQIWAARTDNMGRAEGWARFFQNDKSATQLIDCQAFMNGKKHDLGRLKPFAEGVNRFKIAAPCAAPDALDIVFAVDATGSMGDEIHYLQTELIDVLGRARSQNSKLQLRTGSVFYRDQSDEYITRSSGLTSDSKKTVDFIRKQAADGGGDWPEAVHSALEEAVFDQKWSEKAVARIVFLVLDASPHDDAEVKKSLQKSIAAAAEKGIRIVPIVASGIQKETEWLMKMFGLATNGTYVFLTDHSGIGEKHLEPTTDEYKIEAFNDLLVRIIGEMTTVATCEGKSAIVFEKDPQNPADSPEKRAFFYPNPASSQFTLELPEAVGGISIYDSEGKSVKKLGPQPAGSLQISVADLPDGFFLIRILAGGRWQSGKLVVARA